MKMSELTPEQVEQILNAPFSVYRSLYDYVDGKMIKISEVKEWPKDDEQNEED